MNEAHRLRLDRILKGEIPAGSCESRTLVVMLLAEALQEMKAIRSLLADLSAPAEADAQPEIDPSDLLKGRVSAVKLAIGACESADLLRRCLELETAKAKPRSTVVAAITARVETLN